MRAAKTWVRENPYLPKLSEFETLIEDLRREASRKQSYRMLEERREPTDEDRKNLKEFLDGAKELARKKAMPKA